MHKDAMPVVALRLGLLAFCKHWVRGCQWGAWCEDVGIRHQGQSSFRNEHTSCLPASSPWGPEAQVSKEKHPVHSNRTQMVCRGKPATWSVSGSNVAAPPAAVDLCAPSFSHIAFLILKNSGPDSPELRKGCLVYSVPWVIRTRWECSGWSISFQAVFP